MKIDSIIPVYCKKDFNIGEKVSLFYEGNLMNCTILEKFNYSFCPQFYIVNVIEYPAHKVIKKV